MNLNNKTANTTLALFPNNKTIHTCPSSRWPVCDQGPTEGAVLFARWLYHNRQLQRTVVQGRTTLQRDWAISRRL